MCIRDRTLDVLKTHLSQLHQVAHIAPQYRHLDIEALKNNTANDLKLMQEILMTFQHETHKDLPAAFQALEAGDNRTFHQCIHRIHEMCIRDRVWAMPSVLA